MFIGKIIVVLEITSCCKLDEEIVNFQCIYSERYETELHNLIT